MILLAYAFACARPAPTGIVVVSLDTLRADRLAAWGATSGVTPNLDRFAAESVVFDQAYANANETTYSHAALFTGRRASRIAPLDERFAIPSRVQTLAGTFAAAGWDTAAFVAGGHLARAFGLSDGFRVYDDDASWGSLQDTVPDALTWLDAGRDVSRPFLLFVHGYDAHDRYLKPTPFGYAAASARHDGVAADVARRVGATSAIHANLRTTRLDEAAILALSHPRFARGHALGALEPDAPPLGDAGVAHLTGVYDGAALWADAWFGTLMAGLDARGLLDEVAVVVLSDHGEELGESGVFHHRYSLGDDTLRVPLMVRLPGGREGGRRVSGLTELVDVAPTLWALADVRGPTDIDGVSLVPALDGEAWAGRAYAYAEGALRLRSARGPTARLTAEGLSIENGRAAALLAAAPVDGVSLRLSGDPEALPALRAALVAEASR